MTKWAKSPKFPVVFPSRFGIEILMLLIGRHSHFPQYR